MTRLDSKRVFITGGCGDIGKAVARRLVSEGARVVLGDLLDEEAGLAIAKEISPTSAHYILCDVSRQDLVTGAVAAATAYLGGLDVVISNAGTVARESFITMTEEKWRHVLDVNLTGSFFVAQAAARVMLRNPRSGHQTRGRILFTGSWVQEMPLPEGGSYCSSKAGQAMLMKVVAQELAPEGITCNIVAPGMVYAGLTKAIYDRDPEFRKLTDSLVPAGRMCSADEVAGAFAFLAGSDGDYVTGTSLIVDGGAMLVKR